MFASIILVTSRDCACAQADAAGQVATSILCAAGYVVVGQALVPNESVLVESAILRHVDELNCALVLVLDAGCEQVRTDTLDAVSVVCELLMASGTGSVCGLCEQTVVAALPGAIDTLAGKVSRMLPFFRRASGMLMPSRQMA